MAGYVIRLLFPFLALGVGISPGEYPPPPRQTYDFQVSSELIVVPVSVTDRNGHTALGLQPKDFSITEDGAPQKVLSFSRWDAPTSIGVVFDRSGSMKPSLSAANIAVRMLLAGSEPEDEAFLISFAEAPRLEAGFTRDADRLSNDLLWREARGSTALFDAIYAGLNQMRRAATSRKALVVVTDGGDNHSRYSFQELLLAARESDVQIYTVAIRRNVHDLDEQRGRLQMDELAKETGGRLLIVETDAELPGAAAAMNELIRNQYLLAYRRAEGSRSGKWHRLRVRPQRPELAHHRISAKGGYYGPEY